MLPESGLVRVRMSYLNPNNFEVQVPIGRSNRFSPTPIDRAQPTSFFAGLNQAAFDIIVDSPSLTWELMGAKAAYSVNMPICSGECVGTPLKEIKGSLNPIAIELSKLNEQAAVMLRQAALADMKGASGKSGAEQDVTDAKRSIKRAKKLVEDAQKLIVSFPEVTKVCPNAPPTCLTIDREPTIDALRAIFAEGRSAVVRNVNRAFWRKRGKIDRKNPLIKSAIELEQKGLEELLKIPRFAQDCE